MQVVQTVLELHIEHPIGQLRHTPDCSVVELAQARQVSDSSHVLQLGGHDRQSPEVEESTYP